MTFPVPLPRRVTVVEVGPRDGLQNEATPVATAAKVDFVDRLSSAGLPVIEVSAFVHPQRVPQMADAADVLRAIRRRPGTRYTALVPNVKGLRRALDAGLTEIAVFAAASETFSCRNINQGIEESLAGYAEVCREAGRTGVRVRGYLSTAFGCPFEGEIAPSRVAEIADRLVAMGAFEVAVSDTIGIAHPGQVPEVVTSVAVRIGIDRIALHFHDTRGTGLANVMAGLLCGVTVFDASAGGLGGCPFAPGAAGNLATEDLLYALRGLGIETGVNLEGVLEASSFVEASIGHPLPSRYYRAWRVTAAAGGRGG